MKRSRGFLVFMTALFLLLAVIASPAAAATEEEIQASIDQGIAFLATQQNPDGSWGSFEPTAHTAFVLIKLQDRATELGMDPFDAAYEYADEIVAGWQYIFANSTPYTMSLQEHTAGATGTMDDPDSNSNGTGVYFSSSGSHPVYTTGLVMMALASSGDAARAADGYGYPSVATFEEVCQECADWMALAQGDSGSDEGGWYYSQLDNATAYRGADNSNGGYAVLGLAAAQGFGSTVPDWVKTELNVWIGAIQNPVDGDSDDGGSGYQNSSWWMNELKTGNLIFQMTFYGDTPSTPRFQDAIDYIERHWMDMNRDPGWGYMIDPADYQAIFCLMKGFQYSGVDLIDLDGDGTPEHDWYAEFADVLVLQQDADGAWRGSPWGNQILDTAWALLTLEKVAPPPPVVEVCVDVKPMSWPNPFNVSSNGVLPAAIMGTDDFDVTTVDPATVTLAGVSPLRWSWKDVGTCGDPLGRPDGILDLVFHFSHRAVAAALSPSVDREIRTLELTGALFSGMPIHGQDDVVILVK